MINLLYHHGADPLILNSDDQSPLHIASASNRLSIVKELFSLSQSSLLEIKDHHGRTALSVTTNPDIIDELITSGADISNLDKHNMNVLMIAVSKNQIAIVEHLLFAINNQLNKIFDQVTKRNNRSIFLLAVKTGSIPMCALLLTHPYIRWDTIDKQRMNAFHIAAQNNHSELIEFLCNHIRKSEKLISIKSSSYTDSDSINIPQPSPTLRLYIDAQNEDGKTPLHFAAEQGHTLCVEILLKYGADVLLTNYLGQLALHTAIQNGHSQCVDLLIRYSIKNLANFQSVLSRRQSPLITACQNGFIDIIRLLLSQEIGIDHDNNQEENPLEIAIKYRRIETIHELLEHSHRDYWFMSIRNTEESFHQTPLRDMIRYMPECAKHSFDKLIIKTNEIDVNGNTFERITYNYKYIDDYFM
jgi:ankyrin repeat protein